MSRWRFVVLSALAALAACSDTSSSARSFPLSRPEQLAFACMAPQAANRDAPYIVIPRGCCGEPAPSADLSAPEPNPQTAACTTALGPNETEIALGAPVLHALVSQSTRGEVAAIDLAAQTVLDSDRVVPGFTFLDTGGLPTAIVVPERQPLSEVPRGPAWTFVASAENEQVSAIATCRFRSGRDCGPALELAQNEQRTRVQLPAAPSDMVLGPDDALWVTLPDLGLLARIELSSSGVEPFARSADDQAQAPQFYRVPLPMSQEAPLPVAEQPEYLAVCGLGSAFVPASRTLPLAPRAEPAATVRPTRLHFDAASGLLLVGDGEAPVLHVFQPAEGGRLIPLGALPTGVPIGEFVLTPAVPATAPEALQEPATLDPSVPTRRYLYAIDDDGEGLVMVFDFTVEGPGSLPRLTPLLVPVKGQRFADRLDLPTPTVALEVIDTRARSLYVCGAQTIEALQKERDRLRAQLGAPNMPLPADRATIQAALAQVEARIAIAEQAGPEQLRGVYVVAAAASGLLSVVDVFDLDLACRARRECMARVCDDPVLCPPGNLIAATNPATQSAVAVRRHAVRTVAAGELTATVGSGSALSPRSCAETRVQILPEPAEGEALVCAPRDPWSTVSDSWNINHQAVLPGLALEHAVFEPGPSDDTLIVRAPLGVSFCARGTLPADLVAVVGQPPDYAGCPLQAAGSETLLEIQAAFEDRLVVRARDPNPAAVHASLRACYPDFAGVQVRSGEYLVTSSNGIYLHSVTSDAEGACVPLDDSVRDPLFTSRPVFDPESGDWSFENPYVSFSIRGIDPMSTELPSSRETSVQVRGAATGLRRNNAGRDRATEALPATLRYLPELGALFVVDSARQGLRRYRLRPFEDEGSVFR